MLSLVGNAKHHNLICIYDIVFFFLRYFQVYIYSRTGSLKNDAFTECKLGNDFHGRETRSVSFCRKLNCNLRFGALAEYHIIIHSSLSHTN